jgi:hypothetical protein
MKVREYHREGRSRFDCRLAISQGRPERTKKVPMVLQRGEAERNNSQYDADYLYACQNHAWKFCLARKYTLDGGKTLCFS